MILRNVMSAAIFTAAVVAPAGAQVGPDLQGAVGTVDPIMQSLTSRCPAGPPLSQPWSYSAVVGQGVTQNPFAPLVRPAAPSAGPILGYQQYQLYASTKVTGHYIWKMTFPALSLLGSDRLNHIDGRYQVDFYAQSYRTWDRTSQRWSDWTQGLIGKDVHFAQFIIERRDGVWTPRGTIYMQPAGTALRSVDCGALPPHSLDQLP